MIDDLLFDFSSDEDDDRRQKTYKQRVNFEFQCDSDFHERFRMPPNKAERLLVAVGGEIQHASRNGGALSPKQQLLITLHWLGSGSQYHILADLHGVHKSTVCRSIKTVVNSVNRVLFNRVVAWPENSAIIIEKFYRIAKFPNVCGVVDESLISIDAPSQNEAAFVDRKGGHSLNCMFVCGPLCHFYYVNSNWPGSVHDARVLRRSNLYERMEEENLFPNAVILGDSAYPLKTWLMTPLHEDPNNDGERRYNRRHKTTRQIIECALGILKEKFPCLNHLRVDPLYAAQIVNCCATLCNMSREDNDAVEVNINENVEGYLHADEQQRAAEVPLPAARLRQMQLINAMV